MFEKRKVKAKYCGNAVLGRDLVSLTREIISLKEKRLQQREKELRRKLALQIWNLRRRAVRSAEKFSAIKNQRLQATVRLEAERVYQQTCCQAKQDCVTLSLQIAREVIASEIKSNVKSLSARINSALERLLDTRKVQILVNSQEFERVKPDFDQTRSGVTISKCDDVIPGNARIVTENGEIELSWLAHFDLIQEHLLNTGTING